MHSSLATSAMPSEHDFREDDETEHAEDALLLQQPDVQHSATGNPLSSQPLSGNVSVIIDGLGMENLRCAHCFRPCFHYPPLSINIMIFSRSTRIKTNFPRSLFRRRRLECMEFLVH